MLHFFVLKLFYNQDILPSFFDSFISNILFAIIGLSIWFIIQYYKPAKSEIFYKGLNHFTTSIFIILIWLGITLPLLKFLFSENATYIDLVDNSVAWRVISGIFYYSILSLIYYLFIYYNNLQEKLISEIQLNEKIKDAELNMLKSQINPHFLFNSLNSISSLTITQPEKAREMIIKLSDFLRYTISQPADKMLSLKDELENSKRYLEIEQTRFGSKLIISININDECNDVKIPAMILQPIYENAVKHGVYESTEPINIITECSIKDNFLNISIKNNFDPTAKSRKGEGLGLKNIQERLKLIYNNDKLLKITKTDNLFEIQLFIPILENRG
ncbi:MAG: hypothetical protein A2033_09850 [Bacteroidetes bacterium GWA2_31_9]|nr:MAG: hypothetical protein A2033_09850 [Bacteroidetes bacterium GWA2_31_9]